MQKSFLFLMLLVVALLAASAAANASCIGGYRYGCTGTPGYNSCYSRAQSDFNHCRSDCARDYCPPEDPPVTGMDTCSHPGHEYCLSTCDTERACAEGDCSDFFCEVGCSPADPFWPYC